MPRAGSGPRDLAARAVYETGTLVARYPSVALPVARWRRHGEAVGDGTDLVVEGFPRSGNSFAVAALASAQPAPIRIAHHVHAPANVIAGIRRGLPTLVVVREPEDAVVELVLLKPFLAVAQALRGWVRFHEPLLRYRGRFLVARTDEVIGDLAGVVRRLNERFGTSLREPGGAEEVAEAARRGIGEYWGARQGPGLPLVGRTDGSEEGRREDRERLRGEYRSRRLETSRARAERLHETFTTLVG